MNPRSLESDTWSVRPERPSDAPAIRRVLLAAFPGPDEARLVEALRDDPGAWIGGLSWVATDPSGHVVGHALLTRCHVDEDSALALAPCAVSPQLQRQGVGGAVIRSALTAAAERVHRGGENLVVVLGHPDYYPRFGFGRASAMGVRAPFDVPDEAMMALALDPSLPTPHGVIRYPAAFGV